MRVVWVLEDARRPGGTESVVRTLDELLRGCGVDSSILSWNPPTVSGRGSGGNAVGWLWTKARSAFLRTRHARKVGRRLRQALAEFPGLILVLDPGSLAIAPSLRWSPRWGVQVHWSPELILAPWRFTGGDGVPKVLRPLVWARLRAVGRTNSRSLRAAPFVVTLATSHTQSMRTLNSHVDEIHNPIAVVPAVPRTARSSDATVTIGFLGRLSWEKGPDVLLAALTHLGDQIGPVHAVIAGSGPLAAQLTEQAQRLGLRDLAFVGWTDRPHDVLAQFDVFVLPSRSEGVPLVLVEALAAGCVVVATEAGPGVRDTLADGALGTLVPPDDPPALGLALSRAVLDVRSGRFADEELVRRTIDEHSPEAVAESWLRVLTELLSAAPTTD